MTRTERLAARQDAERRDTGPEWVTSHYGDGYDAMTPASAAGWVALPSWGSDGWDLGAWPLVVVYVRNTDNDYQVAVYTEGDVTVTGYDTAAERESFIDRFAFRFWKMQGESWVEGVDYGTPEADRFRGPYVPRPVGDR